MHRSFTRILVMLTLVLAAFGAPSASAEDVGVELTATFHGGQPAFVQDDEVNPTFTFAPGDVVTMTVTFTGTHNLHVEAPIDEKTPVQDSGTDSLAFTIPDDFTGDVRYVCDVHPSTMFGTIHVAADTTGGNEPDNGTAGNETDPDSSDDGESDEPADDGDGNATEDDVPEGVTLLELTATQEAGELFFLAPDGTRNPTLNFEPGEDVLVRLTVDGSHNLHVGPPVDEKTEVQTGGEAALRFTIPADFEGTIEYWCDPHMFAGMKGVIQVGDAAAGDGGEPSGDGDDGSGDGASDGGDGGDEGGSARTPAPGALSGAFAAAAVAGALGRGRRGRA